MAVIKIKPVSEKKIEVKRGKVYLIHILTQWKKVNLEKKLSIPKLKIRIARRIKTKKLDWEKNFG